MRTKTKQISIIDLVMNTAEAIGGMCGHITIANGSTEEDRDFHDATALSSHLPPGIYTFFTVTEPAAA